MFYLITNKKGMALPLVLMVIVVLMLLGTALWTFSTADALQVERDHNTLEAYNLARSGADATASWIIENPTSVVDILNQAKSSSVSLGSGSFDVKVYGTLDEINIESVGKVDDVAKKINLTLIREDVFSKWAMFSEGDIDYDAAAFDVNGDIGSNGTIHIKGDINGNIYQGVEMYYPPAVFPSDLTYEGDINLEGDNKNGTVSNDGEYGTISLKSNNCALTFELNNGEDRVIRVNMFDANGGDIVLEGNGRLLLFVDQFHGGGNFRIIKTEPENATLHVFVSPGGWFDLKGGGGNKVTENFEGTIYAPLATVDLSGSVAFVGSIIAGDLKSGGPGNVTLTHKYYNSVGLPINAYQKGSWRE